VTHTPVRSGVSFTASGVRIRAGERTVRANSNVSRIPTETATPVSRPRVCFPSTLLAWTYGETTGTPGNISSRCVAGPLVSCLSFGVHSRSNPSFPSLPPLNHLLAWQVPTRRDVTNGEFCGTVRNHQSRFTQLDPEFLDLIGLARRGLGFWRPRTTATRKWLCGKQICWWALQDSNL